MGSFSLAFHIHTNFSNFFRFLILPNIRKQLVYFCFYLMFSNVEWIVTTQQVFRVCFFLSFLRIIIIQFHNLRSCIAFFISLYSFSHLHTKCLNTINLHYCVLDYLTELYTSFICLFLIHRPFGAMIQPYVDSMHVRGGHSPFQ